MKRKRQDPKSTPRKLQPIVTERLADIRGGHAIVDPLAGTFQNFEPGKP
jgi:hypothetical protein